MAVLQPIAAALAALAALVAVSAAEARPEGCQVLARTDRGAVCGVVRSYDSYKYASFLGIPYAKQPVGELRFKELEPAEPWTEPYNATTEGPICHQSDVVYGSLLKYRAGMSEACMFVNVHSPIEALLRDSPRPSKQSLLPVVVFVHGGGFQGGSGDTDMHGPEYLMKKKVVAISFNYRLSVFGFLSLNTPEVPGNQGMRDAVTLLRWVQRNARSFGGDPDNVTLMGQSAGAAIAHLLTLSPVTGGLFKRVFLMSGTGISSFFSTSPLYAKQMSDLLLSLLGITSTDSKEIFHQLVQMPVEKINAVNKILLDQAGFVTFAPVVESAFSGVTRILDKDPDVLVAKGRGKRVPLVVGFTDNECEIFRGRLDEIDIASKIKANPIFTVPPKTIFSTSPLLLLNIAAKVNQKYYNGTVNTDNFIRYCTEGFYHYPAMKLAQSRGPTGAPVYLYEFSYDADRSVLREALDLKYKGAAHIEDLTYVFRTNSVLGPPGSSPESKRDDCMKDWMTMLLVNYMKSSDPVDGQREYWPSVRARNVQLQEIKEPLTYMIKDLTEKQQDVLQFFDSLSP